MCKRILMACLTLFALSGCAGLGSAGLQGMSADQITATAKMKDANVTCVKGTTPITGQFLSVFVNLDKGVIPEGGIEVSPDCGVVIHNTKVTKTVTTVVTPIK